MLLNVLEGITNRLDILGFFVRDLDTELFLELHNQLDQVERIRVEILHKLGICCDLLRFHTELLRYDTLNALEERGRHANHLPCKNPKPRQCPGIMHEHRFKQQLRPAVPGAFGPASDSLPWRCHIASYCT